MTRFMLPESVADELRIALMAARDQGRTWIQISSACLIAHAQLCQWLKRKKSLGVDPARRLAESLGLELKLVVVPATPGAS